MSVQHIWNLFQLLGLKCANNIPKLPGVDYVAKNWALAMMLKALPLVHFWGVLLLKEQMITSVRKTLKTLVSDWFLAKFALKITTKSAVFYRLLFDEVCPENSCEITTKSADFSTNLSLKIPWNLTFSSATCQKPCIKCANPRCSLKVNFNSSLLACI